MRQKRLHSLIETLTNIAIGYSISIIAQILIFPLFGINIPLSSNLAIGAFFTVISIIRSYTIRRWFTKRTFTGRKDRTIWHYNTSLKSDISTMQRPPRLTAISLTVRQRQGGIKLLSNSKTMGK